MGGRVMEKTSNHPMHLSRRCKAHSKRTGVPCKSPAVNGWKVCRMHGARGGGLEGKRNGNYRHGGRTKRTVAALARVRMLVRTCRNSFAEMQTIRGE
jgi:hypothetical protein